MDPTLQATHKSRQNNSWVSLVSHNSDNTSYAHRNTTYKDDGYDDASIAGSIQSVDTLPYELDLALLPKLGGNAH